MHRPHIFVTRTIPSEGIELLKEHCTVEVSPHDRPLTREELFAGAKDADGILSLLTDRIDAEFFRRAPGIRGVANYAVGYDNIDLAEALRHGVPVSNTPGVLTDATAEMAWALLFSACRRVTESDRLMKSGMWKGWGPMQFIGADVTGATLGIIGAGRIGTAMALKSRGFSMKVLYADAFRNSTLEDTLGAQQVSVEELLAQSDFVSVHVPLMESTRHLLDRQAFGSMKRSAYLINTARGPIINEADLTAALRDREIAGAGLDVYEFEPKAVEGLSELPNVVMTPHTASATISSRTGMAMKAAGNLIAMVTGQRAADCVNPGVYQG